MLSASDVAYVLWVVDDDNDVMVSFVYCCILYFFFFSICPCGSFFLEFTQGLCHRIFLARHFNESNFVHAMEYGHSKFSLLMIQFSFSRKIPKDKYY